MSQQAQAEGLQQQGVQALAELQTQDAKNYQKFLAGDMTHEAFMAEGEEINDKIEATKKFEERAAALNTVSGRSVDLSSKVSKPNYSRPMGTASAADQGGAQASEEVERLSARIDEISQLGGIFRPVDEMPRLREGTRDCALVNKYLRPQLGQLPAAKRLKESLTSEDMAYLSASREHQLMNAFVDRDGGWVTAEEMRSEMIVLRTLSVGIANRARQIQTGAMSVSFPSAQAVFNYTKRDKSGQDVITPVRLVDVFGKQKFVPMGRDLILKVPSDLVDDPFFNLIPFLAEEANRISREEDELLMILGSGSGEPLGYLNALLALYAAGATDVGVDPDGTDVPLFSDANFNSEFIQVFDTFLHANARQNAVWTGPRAFERKVRLFRTRSGGDNSGEYLFKRALAAGAPNTLNADPLLTSEFYPDYITSGSAGDPMFHYGDLGDYWWVTKRGLRLKVLDQLYAESNEIGYKYDKAQDGSLTRADANIYARRQAA